ncbi:MAG: glycosyltransferase [Acidobacteriota bacterium]
MSKILVCGLCPLPFENTRQSYGPGIRTWQIAHSLAAAGHSVELLAMRIDGTYGADDESLDREERDGVEIHRLLSSEFFDPSFMAERVAAAGAEIWVGATIYGSNALAIQSPRVPFWADQFGHVMAEAQAKAHLEGKNWPLAHFWNLLRPVLASADRLSVVSDRQRFAAIGELGVAGRLSAETCGYEFTSVMPCALLPQPASAARPLLRGEEIPEGAFVALWSGGYNVWSDVDTLFEALERAMAKAPSLHFLSTGGGIAGHDEETYARFEEAVAGSSFRERYHLQGWVRAELVPGYQAAADLGVLSEIPMYEGQLGSKNRIVQWMGGRLPVLYNRVGDLGDLLAERELGLTFAAGDAAAMAEQLLWCVDNRAALDAMADRARDYTDRELSFTATTRELVRWAASPTLAPDAELRRHVASPADYGAAPAVGAVEEAGARDSRASGPASRGAAESNGSGGHGLAEPAGAPRHNGSAAEGGPAAPAARGVVGRALRRIFSP